jgi:ABC-type antimicrobial peptide transport system permease subunit
MVLGAQRSDMIRSVVGGAVSRFAIGVALGLGAAVLLTGFVQSLLFGVDGPDLLTLGLTSSLLLTFGAAAAYWPARRACSIAPVEALRRE